MAPYNLANPMSDEARKNRRSSTLGFLGRMKDALQFGPAANPRPGANRGWDGTTAATASSSAAPQAPTVATQGAAKSVAQSGGGVGGALPPFTALKPASPFPAPAAPAATPTVGPTLASAPAPVTAQRPSPAANEPLIQVQSPPRPIPGVASGVQTPPSVAQKIADSAVPAAAPSFIGDAPADARTLPADTGAQTFLRKSVIDQRTSATPGATVRPASELNVGGASVVVPGSVANAPRSPSVPAMPTSNSQGFLDNLAAATNALASVDRRADAFVRNDPEAMKRRESFLARTRPFGYNPSEKSKIERARRTDAQQGFMRSMADAQIAGQKGVEEVKGRALVDAKKVEADAQKFPYGPDAKLTQTAPDGTVVAAPGASFMPPVTRPQAIVTPLKQPDEVDPKTGKVTRRGGTVPFVTDIYGKEIPAEQGPAQPVTLDAYNIVAQDNPKSGFLNLGKYRGSDAKAVKALDEEWGKTGLPLTLAPHRGGKGLDFASADEVEALNLPPGTVVTVGGKRFRIGE